MANNNNKNMKLSKSRTFELSRSSSVDKYYQAQAQAHSGPSTVEFPTSPQLIFGEEMLHFGHPQHPLCMVKLPDLFTCAGCKEDGAGKRFLCQRCDYQLHPFCGSAPASLKAHPLHYHHPLLFFSKPVKHGQSKCDMCYRPTKGYAFRCNPCSFQIHPCCAMLTPEMKLMEFHAHTLRLLPLYSTDNYDTSSSFSCGACNRKRSGRVYRCTVCDYHLHAVCAKTGINGLNENGHKDKDKTGNKMLGNAARLASQVMIDFIGGLIEGLAEGVGQVIAQDAIKAKSSSSKTSSA